MKASLSTEDELWAYLSLNNLKRMEDMIVQMMQEKKVELEASPLHMLMIECTKNVEDFA